MLFVVLVGAYIKLLVHAYKKSTTWGLAVFALSPITPTIYGIKYWNEVKKPFLLFSISFVLLIFMAPELMLEGEVKFAEPRTQHPPQQTAPIRVRRTVPKPVVAPVPEKAATVENREVRSTPIRAPEPKGPRFKMISPAEAKDYIGASVILTDINDFDRKFRLIGVSGDRLRFERRMRAGTVSFEYKARDIKSLKVLLD